MMRSMYSGVSGLKNHQTRMDVIGNNIANINTNGYKKSRVVFKDTLYQKLRGATSPVSGGRGGTNPMGIGLGMAVSSVDQIHTATATTNTNKLTDLAIDGNGYFVLKDSSQNVLQNGSQDVSQKYFTRAGNFEFDRDGNLVNVSNGYYVQGWMSDNTQTDAAGDWPIAIVPATTNAINISGYKECAPRATTGMEFGGNLDSATKYNEIQTLSFGGIANGGAGAFRLTFKGQNTSWINITAGNPTATAASMQTALENLGTIGTGNVAVTYNSTAANPHYEIKFQKDLASIDVPSITCTTSNANAYVGGAPGIAVTHDGAVAPANEVDHLAFDTTATGGSYTLTYDGAGATGALTNASTDAQVQTALETAYPALIGKITVTGSFAAGFDITFDSSLGNVNLSATSALTGGSGGNTAIVTETTPGAYCEVQTLTVPGTAGSYYLSYNGQDTGPIAYNAPAADVQAALRAIPALASVTVTGTGVPTTSPYTIQFPNSMGNAETITATPFTTAYTGGTTTVADIDPTDPGFNPEALNSLITSRDVYDSLGNPHTVYFRFFKYGVTLGPPTLSNWACDISLDSQFENASGYSSTATNGYSAIDMNSTTPNSTMQIGEKEIRRLYNLQFDTQGKMVGSTPDDDPFTLTLGPAIPPATAGTGTPQAADPIVFTVDFSVLNQYNADSTAKATYQDGYAAGSMTGYTVGIDGIIRGIYDNGETRSLARLAIANFENPAGMIQVGGTLFQESANSGKADINAPTISGLGSIIPSSLEMSNVDLSEEFTDMITTQRGFQANSRIITTSDEMIQELVNLKR